MVQSKESRGKIRKLYCININAQAGWYVVIANVNSHYRGGELNNHSEGSKKE